MKFIAEISSNHLQSLKRIKKFIKTSKYLGCYAVKFQLFKVEKLFRSSEIKKFPRILERKNWELPEKYLNTIKNECKKNKIKFGCTPFDLEAVDVLKDKVDFLKISSYELLWEDLLIKCAKTKKPIILSSGMANFDEVKKAVNILTKYNCTDLTILHCCSNYPTNIKDCNLSVIELFKKKFKCKVGWSDHSVNKNVLIRALCKWDAEVIEFHLDLDGKGSEFNNKHCWLPEEIKKVISFANEWPKIDGKAIKKPTQMEIKERKIEQTLLMV